MSPKKRVYILLGRAGDILNLLPAIEYESKTEGYKPKLIVAKEYADILDGCNYVEKIIHQGDFRKINGAVFYAKRQYAGLEIVNCAVYGDNYPFKRQCSSFTREIWKFSKCERPQNSLPLNFDNRDQLREAKVISDLVKNDKPIIIVALSGHSSPLDNAVVLLEYLKDRLEGFQIIDISDYNAERFYDLLGLYEKAHCLIAIDSAPLHLANAVPTLPVISLISDLSDEWHQSGWRENHILRILYSEIENKMGSIIEAAKQGKEFRKDKKIHFVTSFKEVMRYDDQRRNKLALRTRIAEMNTQKYGCYNYLGYKRKSTEGMPYVKDMIDFACAGVDLDEIIMICNSDICFVPGITGLIIHAIDRHESAFFHRWDNRKSRIMEPLVSEAGLSEYVWYDGSDAFVFTKLWWVKNKDLFPDMVFGREYWDNVFRNLIKKTGGTEIHKAIYHEKHEGLWEKGKRKRPDNNYNKTLALEWYEKYGGGLLDWKTKPEEWKEVYKEITPINNIG